MAKCCSIRGGAWGDCQETDWPLFQVGGWSEATTDYFITGLYRGTTEDLSSIQEVHECRHAQLDTFKLDSI